jgi:Fanconi anemia group D2 protein
MSEYNWEENRTKYEKSVLNGTMKTQLWFGLDDRASPLYVKMLELLCSPDRMIQESIQMICPLMSLLLACARKRNDIESMECLLICPLSLVEKNIFEDLNGLNPIAQEAVMDSLFYAVNWIRCLLNFFSVEKEQHYRIVKTIARLDNLLTLEEIIKENLWQSPTFMPPNDVNAKKNVGVNATNSKGPKKKNSKFRLVKIQNNAFNV